MKSSMSSECKSHPCLEALEQRLVLDNSSFVNNLYHDLLGRNPDSTGSASWVFQLNNGMSRQVAATDFWRSREHRQFEVNQFYQKYLGRSADPSGSSAWVNALQAGATELQVEQGFLNSTEYKGLHSGDKAYVDALYADVLGRAPSGSEEAAWIAVLDQNGSGPVVSGIVNSSESYRHIVDLDFTTYLDRSPDSSGESFWTSVLQNNGGNVEQVAEAILASDEYLALGPK